VLTACSQPALVQRAEPLLNFSTRLLGATATEAMLRHSVFAHFVAGEDEADIAPVISRLRAHGVGGILDYAAEAELDESGAAEHAVPNLPDVNQPSRTYPYEGEAKCEANKRIFLSAVRAVKATSPDGFAAVKVTALGDPALLERVSTAVLELRAFFDRLGGTRHEADGRLTIRREAFVRGWCEAFHADESESEREFERLGGDVASATIDVLDFTNRLSLDEIGPLVARCRSQGPLYRSALTAEECDALHATMARLDVVASLATSVGVRLMIDAEQSYLQPAIAHATLRLQRTHNVDYPAIFSTHQAYLVGCAEALALDVERARREGWHLGVKLVRGAYMLHERERARRLGRPDPIHPTAEATHASYDAAIDALLLAPPCPTRTSLMIATHNQASVERAARLLRQPRRPHGESAGDGVEVGADVGVGVSVGGGEPCQPASRVPHTQVYFGQLLGMADHLTFHLAAHGLNAYKYLPYGPVAEVVPYLLRRAHENADALSNASTQRNMMLREAWRRMTGL